MNFTNNSLSPEELPTILSVSFHPLEKGYLVVESIFFFIRLLVFLLLAIALIYFVEPLQESLIVILAAIFFLLLSIIGYVTMRLSFKYSGYALREKDLLFRSGWLKRKVRIVVRNRIQHVSVQSGPIERKFGLSSVSVFTAGSSEADFTIKGITEKTAKGIKEWISTDTYGDLRQ